MLPIRVRRYKKSVNKTINVVRNFLRLKLISINVIIEQKKQTKIISSDQNNFLKNVIIHILLTF